MSKRRYGKIEFVLEDEDEPTTTKEAEEDPRLVVGNPSLRQKITKLFIDPGGRIRGKAQ